MKMIPFNSYNSDELLSSVNEISILNSVKGLSDKNFVQIKE